MRQYYTIFRSLIIFAITLTFYLFLSLVTFADEHDINDSYGGLNCCGESMLFPGDSTQLQLLNEKAKEDAHKPTDVAVPQYGVGAGVDFAVTSNRNIITIPASYDVKDNITVGLNLPLAYADIITTDFGLGDISCSGIYKRNFYLLGDNLRSRSGLSLKFPTGSKDANLGSGSFDMLLSEYAYLPIFDHINLTGGADYKITIGGGVTDIIDVNLGTQIEGRLPDFVEILGKFYSGVNFHSAIWIGSSEFLFDVVPQFAWWYRENMSLYFNFVIPVDETTGVARETTFNFGAIKYF